MQCTRMLSISLKIQSKAKCVWERGGRRLKTCQGSFQIVKRPLHGRRGIHLNNTVPPLPNHFLAMAILQNILNTKAWMVQSSIQWLYSLCQIVVRVDICRVANHPLYNYKEQTIHGSKIRVFQQLQQHKKCFSKKMACRSSALGVWNVHSSSYNPL